MVLIEWRRWTYVPEMVQARRRRVSKEARRVLYPNRRSPYVPNTAVITRDWR